MGKIKNDIKEFYLTFGRENRNLTTTRVIASLWWGILTYNKHIDQIEEAEKVIEQWSKIEWDTSTICEFDRLNKKILVKSTKKNRRKEISFYLTGESILN